MTQNFRFSLKYKFLVLLTAMLLTALLAYMLMAIKLFRNDKSAYVYEVSDTLSETLAAETETGIHSNLRTLELIANVFARASNTDSANKLSLEQKSLVQSIFNGDDDLVELSIYVEREGGQAERSLQLINANYLKPYGVKAEIFDKISKEKPIAFDVIAAKSVYLRSVALDNIPPLLTLAVSREVSVIKNKQQVKPKRLYLIAQLRQDRRLKMFSKSKEYTTYLIDSVGNIIAHPNVSFLLRGESVAGKPIINEILRSKIPAGVREYAEKDGQAGIIGYAKLQIADLVVLSEISRKRAFYASQRLIEKSIIFGVLILILSFIISILFTSKMTSALGKLFAATGRVGSGDFNVSVQINTRDEVGSLSVAFNAMTKKIVHLLAETAEKAKLEKEVETAQLVQENFFPVMDLSREGLQIAAFYQPASRCGGDWWGHIPMGDKTAILIGDATGHGVPAALITAAAHACCVTLKHFEEFNQSHLTAKTILEHLNRAIFHSGRGKIKMTFFVAVIDSKTGELEYANAAHEMPIIYRSKIDSESDSYAVTQLDTLEGEPSSCLGQSESTAFATYKTILNQNDAILWYTDGLVECVNEQEEEYGERRLNRRFIPLATKSAREIVDGLMTDAIGFYGTKLRADDITLVALKIGNAGHGNS